MYEDAPRPLHQRADVPASEAPGPVFAGAGTTRRQLLKMAAFAGLALPLAACGHSAGAQSGKSAGAQSGKSAGAQSGKKVQLKFWKYQDPSTDAVLKDLVAQYSQVKPNVEVSIEFIPFTQYLGEKVTSALQSGAGPDVFWVSAATVLGLVPHGLLLPLDDTFTPTRQADFLPETINEVKFQGKVYGVPHEMGVQGLLYNQSILNSLSIEPPKTWDDLISAAEKIKSKTNSYGISLYTDPNPFQNFIWYPFLWQSGGSVIDPQWTHATINSDAGAAALDLWGELIRRGLAPRSSTDNYGNDLGQQKCAMQPLGVWALTNLQKTYPKIQVGATPFPTPQPGGSITAAFGGWFTSVSAATKHPAEAKEFATWLFGEDPKNAVSLLTAEASLSPRESVNKALADLPIFKSAAAQEFFTIRPHARPEPAYPNEVETAITSAIQSVMFGGKSGKAAAATAAGVIDRFLQTSQGEALRKVMAQ